MPRHVPFIAHGFTRHINIRIKFFFLPQFVRESARQTLAPRPPPGRFREEGARAVPHHARGHGAGVAFAGRVCCALWPEPRPAPG